MTDVLLWIWLQEKLGYASKYAQDVLQHPGGARYFYESSEHELKALGIFSEKIIKRLCEHSLEKAESIYIKCLALGHSIITPDSDCYPMALRRIADPPLVIYAKGNVTAINNILSIAIVGTRRALPYYSYVAQEIGYRLANAGVSVVSGCAVGIDTSAHSGALATNGITVGVLGCGIDYPYNRRGEKLRNAITVNGAIISEYPPGAEPRPEHFPQRNRIISGLSLGVVVVQAGHRSGSLITAKLALEQGRELFVYYSEINLATLAGIHELGESNVTLVKTPAEILRPFEARFGNSINFDGLNDPFRSRPDLMPQNVQNVISGMSASAEEQQKGEAVRPVSFNEDFRPVAAVSIERKTQPVVHRFGADVSSETARQIAKAEAVCEVVNYSSMDAGDEMPNEINKEPQAIAEKELDENLRFSTNSNIAVKYYKDKVSAETIAVDSKPSVEQIISSAERIGLSQEQINALVAQLGKSSEDTVKEAEPQNKSREETATAEKKSEMLPDDLSDEARKLYSILLEHSDTMDNLAVLAGMTISMAAESMLELELYGLVCSLPGGIYSAADFFFQ